MQNYCYHDDGNATERFIDIVLKGKESENVIKNENNKKKILFYCGGFYNNGITISAINLMNNLDYSKYEIVVIESSELHDGKENNIKTTPKCKCPLPCRQLEHDDKRMVSASISR